QARVDVRGAYPGDALTVEPDVLARLDVEEVQWTLGHLVVDDARVARAPALVVPSSRRDHRGPRARRLDGVVAPCVRQDAGEAAVLVLVDQPELTVVAAEDHDTSPTAERIVCPRVATGMPVASPCTASSTFAPASPNRPV